MTLEIFLDKLTINTYSLLVSSIGLPQTLYGISKMAADGTIDKNYQIDTALGLSVIATGFLATIPFQKIQNRNYNKIKSAIEKRGYHEKLVRKCMDYPCGRMVIKAVLKRTKNYDKYPTLKEKFPLTRIC